MKDALVVLGMGGPDSTEAIKPFLRNLFSDREIINFHVGDTLQKFIAGRIAKKRSKEVAPRYMKMGAGGGSPQLALTKALLKKVAPIYKKKVGRELDTYAGMCYWHPFIEDTMKEVLSKDYGNIFFLPMYPQYSTTTSGACFSRLDTFMKNRYCKGRLIKVSCFYDNDKYLSSVVSKIEEACKKTGVAQDKMHLLFSAHSIPQYLVEYGDPYVQQLEEQTKILVDRVKPSSWSLAYQSKYGKIKWLEPFVTDEMERLAKDGVKDIIIVAVSFINDHIETLVELDDELILPNKKLGMNVYRAETLNDSDDFADAVLDILLGGLCEQ